MRVAMPLYSQALDGIVDTLKEVAAAEAAVLKDLNFLVSKNRSRPYIEDLKNKALVNVLLYRVETDKKSSSKHGKVHRATYHLDMYVKGMNTDMTPPDEVAMARLHLLTAQVEYAITRLKNYYFGLTADKIGRETDTTLTYYPHEHDDSEGVYAPARFEFTCLFPYDFADDCDRSDLTELDVSLLEDWSLMFNYSDD